MSDSPDYPASFTLDDVLVRVNKSRSNPNIGQIHDAKLYEGPRVSKVATLQEILVGETGEHHHWSLKVASFRQLKAGWYVDDEKSVTIDGSQGGSVQKLLTFLQSSLAEALPDEPGKYHVLSGDTTEGLENLVELVGEASDQSKMDFLEAILRSDAIGRVGAEQLVAALESSPAEVIKNLATATRLVEYQRALDKLKKLVKDCCKSEETIQKHLEANPWLFGSEYSTLLDQRKWTRNDNLDFMLRRTTDGYLEIIEIKTPFAEPILLHDKSHDSYYSSSKLSKVQGQVSRYITEVKRKRDSIRAQDREDPLEISARVIIGRDGEEAHQHALRSHNAHLHGMEILTFDQLVRVGVRTLEVFKEEAENDSAVSPAAVQAPAPTDDLPF